MGWDWLEQMSSHGAAGSASGPARADSVEGEVPGAGEAGETEANLLIPATARCVLNPKNRILDSGENE